MPDRVKSEKLQGANPTGLKLRGTELQNTEQGRMNVEVGQPSVAAMDVGTEADPTSYFDIPCSIFDIQRT